MDARQPTIASMVVTVLILIAVAATVLLFALPGTHPWFWPIAGVLAAAIALGILIPLGPRRT